MPIVQVDAGGTVGGILLFHQAGPRDSVQVIRKFYCFGWGYQTASCVAQAGFELACVAEDVDLILLPLPPKY